MALGPAEASVAAVPIAITANRQWDRRMNPPTTNQKLPTMGCGAHNVSGCFVVHDTD
jgi:hypothetical protein